MKILEKSGQPIINLLQPKFSIKLGCPEGREGCGICKKGDGILCSKKNLVYQASCDTCSEERKKRQSTPLHTSSPKREHKNSEINSSFSLQADLSAIELKERKNDPKNREEKDSSIPWSTDHFLLDHRADRTNEAIEMTHDETILNSKCDRTNKTAVCHNLVEYDVMVSDENTPKVKETKVCSVMGQPMIPQEGQRDIPDTSEEMLSESNIVLMPDENTSSAKSSKDCPGLIDFPCLRFNGSQMKKEDVIRVKEKGYTVGNDGKETDNELPHIHQKKKKRASKVNKRVKERQVETEK